MLLRLSSEKPYLLPGGEYSAPYFSLLCMQTFSTAARVAALQPARILALRSCIPGG
jgi:hypothetical protein